MKFKQVKPRHLWRELLMLFVCLFTGYSTVHAKSQFTDDIGMKITHQPSMQEPYIIVEVLYFDAEGNDSYFTTAAQETGHNGPAVYVRKNSDSYKWICSPFAELAWNTHQKTAAGNIDQESWWASTNPELPSANSGQVNTYNNNDVIIRFYNPHRRNDRPSGEYYVYMYVFMKEWKVGDTYSVKIKGTWKVNEKSPSVQEKVVTTEVFTNYWSAPTAILTGHKKVTVFGNLSSTALNGNTTVGLYSSDYDCPSGYVESPGATKTFDKTISSFAQGEGPVCDYTYSYSFKTGSYIPVQFSYPFDFTLDNWSPYFNGSKKPIVYSWFKTSFTGFKYPRITQTYEVTDQWEKKVKIKWTAYGGTYASSAGTWMIKNHTTDNTVSINKASAREGEIAIKDYSTDNEIKADSITVYFVPDGYSGNPISTLGAGTKAWITPNWNFTNFKASVIEEGANQGKISLTWKHNAIGDASASKKYTIKIYRSLDDETYTETATSVVDNSSTTEGSYIDTPEESGKTYYYKLKVENLMGKTFDSDKKSARSGASTITSFTATRGSYSNMVKLQWNIHLVGNSANFIVQRRPLGTPGDEGWADIYSTSGTTTSYSYDDVTALPGSFNQYRLVIWTEEVIGGKTVRSIEDAEESDGFSISTGIVSGNVSYGTGTAVEGVKVTLKQQATDGDIASGMHSLKLSGAGAGVQYATDGDALKSLFNSDFSIQMYVNPNSGVMSTDNDEYQLFHIADVLDVRLKYNETATSYTLAGSIGGTTITSTKTIAAGEWTHLTLTYTKSSKELTYYVTKEDAVESEVVATVSAETIWPNSVTSDRLTIGNTNTFNSANYYDGYIDEFRLWTKALTDLEISRNYNHPLAGKESSLAIYYPFDEGIAQQEIAYDFSKKNGVSNGRHGSMNVSAASTEVLPSENQLSLMAYTDVNGYYEIRGVPFSGEGSSYSVIPTMGIHEFSPAAKSRYVSMSTLNHSGVDFEDVSSFPVSGTVFYADTDYPVEGVNFYVDGNICSKDGEMITTNEKGEYTISVPIGDHFITIKKNGHVFALEGRYPEDPNNVGTKHTFDKEIKNLDFIDETLVNFTGRVVGGDIEGGKAVGFGLSNNNIGEVELVLSPLNSIPRMNVVKEVTSGVYSYETNEDDLDVASATDNINSTSWRGSKQLNCRKIFIRTDKQTGEFSAMIPPLEYAIESIKVVKTDEVVGDPITLDLSNPLLESSDTLHNEDGTDVLYTYHTALKQVYHSTPTFIVTQKDHEDETTHENDGAFGIKSYEMEDAVGKLTVDDIYEIVNNSPVYKYGGAVFVMNDRYTFNIEAYEEYENSDNTPAVTDHVPLSDIVVTINNALSNEQAVAAQDGSYEGKVVKEGEIVDLKSNQLMLDEEGKATYSWIAGMPNIVEPYTRTISITYDIGDRTYQWSGSGMDGVVLGSLPTGNNFVTAGPDVVDMILRDPPGSGSSAEWTSGTISSFTRAKMGMESVEAHVKTTAMLGSYAESATGFGVYMINTLESKVNIEGTLSATEEFEGGDTYNRTIQITKTIATSEETDYVGSQGDIFIGQSTNVLFGAARNIDFHRKNANSNEVELQLDNVITTGLSFGTMFNYTQYYIEEDMLPHLAELRDSYLQTVTSERLANYVNNGNEPVYLTTLDPSDPRFGSDNNDVDVWGASATPTASSQGPSYTMILPQNVGDQSFTDQILWCNSQIAGWIGYLELNEREKVEAYENRNDKDVVKKSKNYSFDSGSKVTDSYEKEEGEGFKYTVRVGASLEASVATGGAFNHVGVFVEVGGSAAAGYVHEHEDSESDLLGFSYTLAESGTNDALTVDVYEYGDYGPIFRTLGGQTSDPYEGKVVTKYYKPGTTIMDATMQVEVPQIDVDVPVMSDVPTGSAANYTLRLGNASEVNKDVTYKLFILDGTNPDGAQISIDGQILTEGRLINVPGGQRISKSLQLKQTKLDVLDYEGNNDVNDELYHKGIGVVFASESQPEDIADTVFITARFTPSSSPVSLALSNSIMNTSTGTDLVLTFKDFDRNYKNLLGFRLQYKKQGATDWTQLREYVLGEPTGNQIKMPSTGASVSYTLPMASYSDGNYTFRVVSASSYGSGEVYRYSEELDLVKDMQRPTPLGQPEPADGILNIGDDLSVTFNEIILKGELTKTANFKVTGVLNGQPVAHWTALSMQNTAAAASTDANINLAGKDFSFDAWINLTAGAGTLLSHGNGTTKMTVGIDVDQKLVVTIAGVTYTSANTIPTGKWAFLTLSYRNTGSGSLLNASVADDANTTNLFVDKAVVNYNGNGRLTVGVGITGAIHELLLWDEAHDMTTALFNRSITKNPSTRHLIGYWKMDEGEGTSIRDYSRNRHMTMAADTWYLNNDNKSVVLDGSHYLKIDASCLPVCVDDDYAVEFWMRGEVQSDAQLLQMGEISLWVKADGTLQFTGKGAYNDAVAVTFATNATNLTDNAWHHIAVNVLRQGAAAVYVDGVRCLTTSSANVGGINTNSMFIGVRRITESAETGTYSYDRKFKGMVDEVRVWNATMNSDMLLKNRRVRLTGTEDGLIAYYSFETQTLDQNNQIQSVGTAQDLTSNVSAELLAVSDHQSAAITYSNEAPAMRQKPVETNVGFTFVASNEKVVINIDEDPAIVEGCTLNFTVRDLRDENGNYSVPAVWSAFVNRNELEWEEDDLSIEQEVKEGGEISAYIINNGGAQQMWTLSGMPSWLTASSEYGTTNPLSETEVIFYVSPATPIGKYEETVYLKGNNGIETPLTLHVNVTGQAPEWTVNANKYFSSMNVIGRVEIDGVPMDDTDDILAAFIGEECRGVAHPVYSKRYDTYYVTIDIYGDTDDETRNAEVSFRVYDASTGTLYPVINPSTVIKYENLSLVGKYDTPVVLDVQDYIEQSIDLKEGWNWISFNVTADDMSAESVLSQIADDVVMFKNQTKYLEYDGADWDGNMVDALSNTEMYAVKMNADRNLRIVGHKVADNTEIALASGWNWIGYYDRQVSSITDALANASPFNGDILKGQTGVSYYDVYEWAGSIEMMEPGVGYIMYNTQSAKSFWYYGSSSASPAPMRSPSRSITDGVPTSCMFNAVDYHMYSGNATMTARVMKDNKPLANVELAVFADGECRAVTNTNDKGIAYLTIPGDDEATLTFKVMNGSEMIDANESVTYETDAIYGTTKNPYVINLGTSTGIGKVVNDEVKSVYDLQGRKVVPSVGNQGLKGEILIIDGKKEIQR